MLKGDGSFGDSAARHCRDSKWDNRNRLEGSGAGEGGGGQAGREGGRYPGHTQSRESPRHSETDVYRPFSREQSFELMIVRAILA